MRGSSTSRSLGASLRTATTRSSHGPGHVCRSASARSGRDARDSARLPPRSEPEADTRRLSQRARPAVGNGGLQYPVGAGAEVEELAREGAQAETDAKR